MLAIVTEESKHAPNFLLTTINPLDNGHTPNETISSFLANYRGMHEMCAVPLRFARSCGWLPPIPYTIQSPTGP